MVAFHCLEKIRYSLCFFLLVTQIWNDHSVLDLQTCDSYLSTVSLRVSGYHNSVLSTVMTQQRVLGGQTA